MWPVMHPCGIATVNCSEFDRAFDQYGVIKRQCTKEGAQNVKLDINLHPNSRCLVHAVEYTSLVDY